MRKFLTTVWIWFFGAVSLVLLFIPFFILKIVSWPFDRRGHCNMYYTSLWGILYLKILPIKRVEVIDKHKLKPCMKAVAISNHQSMVDIMVLFDVFPYYVWVSKKENFQAPILGWVMHLNGYIRLDRKNPKTFPKMYKKIAEKLAKNYTIMMFPEGTRSKNNEVGRFKEGAFKAAIDNKASIVPIVLDGTGTAIPKEGIVVNKGDRIIVKVLDEVPYDKFPTYNPAELKEYFRDLIAKELVALRSKN
jgi:1-acyl-sn-glycerol-3-phosphate acyltransferase